MHPAAFTPDEQLPATGASSTHGLALIGLGLVLMGSSFLGIARPRLPHGQRP
jgi:LPXTG-motif cell wall-anchored protein